MTQIYCVDIRQITPEMYGTLYRQATSQRQQRADRYRHREDALRCITAGALLRFAAFQALGVQEFSLDQGPSGKPCLMEYPDFHFNLSHSGSWVVLAWGPSEIGIDVEAIRPDVARKEIARRYFTQAEQDYIFETEANSAKRFFRIWTGKESILKYLGTGLTKSLTSVCTLSPEYAGMLQFRLLPDGYCLSLCSGEEDSALEFLDPVRLLPESF